MKMKVKLVDCKKKMRDCWRVRIWIDYFGIGLRV